MSVYNAYLALSGTGGVDVSRDEPLSYRTSYHIGGAAALVCVCHTFASLSRVVDVLTSEKMEWVVLGKGSNVLAADQGYDGCVIILGKEFSRIGLAEDDGVCAGAAAIVSKLMTFALSNELTGAEFLAGIPGTIGGAVTMDAGTRHEWIGSLVRDVVVLRPGEGMYRYETSDIDWGYRRTSIPTSEIVLEATLSLEPGDKARIAAEMDRRLRMRRKTQPTGKPCCGSVFKNPGDASVAEMLDKCGLRGYSVGGAQVSPAHANFIVNNGWATADDVCTLMKTMYDKVKETYDVDLQPEVKFLGIS